MEEAEEGKSLRLLESRKTKGISPEGKGEGSKEDTRGGRGEI